MRFILILIFLLLSLDVYALDGQKEQSDPFSQEVQLISDPFEPVNRVIFTVNDRLYFYVLKPTSKVLKILLPEPVRESIYNFHSNILAPISIVNSLLQGKLDRAGDEYVRFSVNTVFGVFGLFDPATKYFDLPKKEEDCGQTLGHYGIGHGPYIVLPFIGPSSLRDTVGIIGDSLLNPLSYVLTTGEYVGVKVVDTVNYISLNPDLYDNLVKHSLDPYTAVKDAYTQRRKAQVED